MKTTLRPLSDHMIIKPLDEEKVTSSGIVLPDNATEKPTRGEILAVGPGKKDEKGNYMPMSVKVGDTVLFKKYGPDEIEIDGEKIMVASEEDVLAVVEQ